MNKNFFSKCVSLLLILIILFNYLQFPENFAYGAVSYSGQTAVGEYSISTKEQLNLLAQLVNSGNSYAGSTFTLTNNITYDSSTTNNYVAIGKSGYPFKGVFDGNGFSIGGININQITSLSNVGIFGYIDSASIMNLSLVNSTISAFNYVGGIVGNAQNSILDNCINNSTIYSYNDYLYTTGNAGGIVGYGYKTIIKNSSNIGEIAGINAGGIVGELKGTDINHGIFNSVNNGRIQNYSSSLVDHNYQSGGGIVGRASNIVVRNCTNTGGLGNYVTLGSSGGIAGVTNNVQIYFSINNTNLVNVPNGGIVGYLNNGLVYGCINNTGAYEHSSSYNKGYAGGIASIAINSEITYSKSKGDIHVAPNASIWNGIEFYAGGLVGHSTNVNISYSYSSSSVYTFGGKTTKGYSSIAGGLVGFSINTNVKNSYRSGYTGDHSGSSIPEYTKWFPIGGRDSISATNTHYIDNNPLYTYEHIGQPQTAEYMKSQEFVNLLNSGTGGTGEKDIKNPFVKTTQNNGYPIFWFEQKIESMVIDGVSSVVKDNTIILKVITVPENITGKEISWTTSDSSIAEILSVGNGKAIILKGVRKGSVTITAKATDGSNKVATKTINVVSGFIPSKANYIVVGEKVEYRLGWKDSENDPKYKEEFRYIHTPNKFKDTITVDNTMGLIDYNNQWQNNKFTQFSKVGTYKIQYRIQDNPPTANKANFENYRYYSDKSYADVYTNKAESIIYVHRKPIAMYTIATNGSSLTDYSYDLDHSITHGTKGIAKWEWKCISNSGDIAEYTETNKTTGVNKVNTWISTYRNLGYKIVLRVQDIEGAWSEPTIKGIGEYSKPIADFAIEKNPLLYPENQTITDLSYDTNGLALTYQWNVYKNSVNVLSSTNNNITSDLNSKILSLFPNVTGTYTVSLKVVNSAGVESSTVTKTFDVVVYNQAPTANFDLVSNELPAWTFPKVIGLYTLKLRPISSLFHEEKTRFNVNVTDPNTDNLGFIYNWKLERFAVKDINNILGAANNIYSYTTQYPFTNSFKTQGLPWGAYRITLSVTDKPPIPPYQIIDAKTSIVIKNYYIVPELSLTGSYESENPEIMVGDIIKLKAITNKMTENVICTFTDTDYALRKVSEDSNFVYWEKNISVPDSITESGIYQIQFTGSTTYGGNGIITREVRDTVSLNIVALKLINFRITNIVNHPHISFPQTKDMLQDELISYKTGYYITFQIDSKGKPDNVYSRIDIGNNGSIDKSINMTKVASGETETWQGRFYTTAYIPTGTVISIKLDCNKGETIYDYNIKESWDGRSLIINGSALQDGRINLTN